MRLRDVVNSMTYRAINSMAHLARSASRPVKNHIALNFQRYF
jgi:hypothetical protein